MKFQKDDMYIYFLISSKIFLFWAKIKNGSIPTVSPTRSNKLTLKGPKYKTAFDEFANELLKICSKTYLKSILTELCGSDP